MSEKILFRGPAGSNAAEGKHVPVQGPVLLRLTLSYTPPPCKHIKTPEGVHRPGHKVIEYWADSPTEEAIENWAEWAAKKFYPGTTHTYPETYTIRQEYLPGYDETVTILEVENGS